MNNKLKTFFMIIGVSLAVSACQEDPKLPANEVEFEATVAGITAEETSLTIHVNLSRKAEANVTLTFLLETSGVEAGSDFTLEPAPAGNQVTVTVPKGEQQGSIVLSKTEGVLLDGDETITLTLADAGGKLVVGEKSQLVISFSEIIVAQATMDIQGGGPTYPNKVFIDLSASRQTAVERSAWDLGFSSGDNFSVTLNAANGMMAYELNKTDLTTVTSADTVGLGAKLSVGAVFAAINSDPIPAWASEAINWIDDPTGNLANTAIAPVSGTPSENKVYIINRGDGPGNPATKLGWKKIRVLRSASGYTLQYADINATTFSEVQVTRKASHAFQYVSFVTGELLVEPETEKWDIAWTGFTNSLNYGFMVPYYFQDVILQNTSGVQTLQVLTTTKTYEAFAESDIPSDFGAQTQTKIGSSWRTGGGPSGPPSLRTDRFYLIKDAAGNIYKLRFTALTQSGERGRPAIEFALVKEGE